MRVLVITARRFNGHEFWVGVGALTARGISYDVVSTDKVLQDEKTRERVSVKMTLDGPFDVEYDGLMVTSGNPKDTTLLWWDKRVREIVSWFADKPVAAICAAVPAIRYIAEGKQVAAFPLVSAKELLRTAGAELSTKSLVLDGKIVTAEHQMRSIEWANTFADLLEGKEVSHTIVDSGFVPKGGKMRPPKPIREMMATMGNPWKDTIKKEEE